jgi:hypothetical protein
MFYKIGSCFWFKKFRVKLAQVSKIGFKVFSLGFGKQKVSFGKVRFSWLAFFLQSQVSEIGFKIFSKSFDKFGSSFFAKFIFSGKVNFSQSQFLAKVSASSRFCVLVSQSCFPKSKSGL